MGVRKNFSRGRQRRHIAYPFQVADDTVQMDGHNALYPFYTTKEIAHDTATVTKNALCWQ